MRQNADVSLLFCDGGAYCNAVSMLVILIPCLTALYSIQATLGCARKCVYVHIVKTYEDGGDT